MPFPGAMNIKAVSSTLAQAYGINLANPMQLRPIEAISRPTLDAAYDFVDDFRPLCNGAFNWLLNFLRFLDQGGNASQKIVALKRINLAFGIQANDLPNTIPVVNWTALGNACSNLPVFTRPYLNAFFRSRNAGTALRDIEGIFRVAYQAAPSRGAEALEVMKTVMERNGDASGVTAASILALVNMLLAHRPMSGFMGFTQWGPGDNANPPDNLDAHVLKHVCRQPLDVEFGISETMAWWDVLHIRLTRADYDLHAVNPMSQAYFCFEGNQPLSGANLKRFLLLQAFNNEPALTQFVKNQAIGPYRDYAIENSRVMSDVIVHSNGTRVFISGRSGDSFIIGRFEGVQLGISSCYKPLDITGKLRAARSNMCWPLR